jgi:asparagine synthase (glutamine-hydrolysing)
MADALAHRGPDDEGVWTDPTREVALAHRRLAILDLSPAGHQPMLSADERFVVVLNGEIYNHEELRRDISVGGVAGGWRGHSDTETLVEAFALWGIEATLPRVVGMFAFAAWDRMDNRLTLACDRFGEKPLYYGWIRGSLVFTSELKAIHALPAFDRTVSRRAVSLFMRLGYVPAPWTIWEGVSKLEPGTLVHFDRREAGVAAGVVTRYWSLGDAAARSRAVPFSGSEEDASTRLEALLNQAIRGQMVADVPLGAFLSGGVDSSTVVALMQGMSSRPVKTFTIGFREREYDESDHALAVARHLGTDHTALDVTAAEARDVIFRLPHLYDEPFGDSSQIPTFLVSQLARRHVTVALSGDGGDEVFGGYNRYFWTMRLWKHLRRVPRQGRNALARAVASAGSLLGRHVNGPFAAVFPDKLRRMRASDRAQTVAKLLRAETEGALYGQIVSHWDATACASQSDHEIRVPEVVPFWFAAAPLPEKMMYLDSVSYLPGDILVKVDRAAMAVGLETRVPLLDHRVVEFAWSLPTGMKIDDAVGKKVLRRVLHRFVPPNLIERPKMGFGVPIDHWLRGPLKDWGEHLLDPRRLKEEGYFSVGEVRAKWEEHRSGRRNWQYHLWDVLMFQSWHEAWGRRAVQ